MNVKILLYLVKYHAHFCVFAYFDGIKCLIVLFQHFNRRKDIVSKPLEEFCDKIEGFQKYLQNSIHTACI